VCTYRKVSRFLTPALCAAAILACAAPVNAGPVMNLQLFDSFGNTGVITGTQQLVQFTGTVGNYNVSLSAGASNNPGGFPSQIHITNLQVTLNGKNPDPNFTDVLHIRLAEKDFSIPVGTPLTLGSSGSGTWTGNAKGGDVWTFKSWADGTDSGNFNTGTATAGVKNTNAGEGSSPLSFNANDTLVNFNNPSNLYSLSNETTIQLTSSLTSADTTGASTVTATPEPCTTVLFLTALPAFGAGYLARRRKNRLEVDA